MTDPNNPDGIWRKDLVCAIFALQYDFLQHAAALHLQYGHCCDMNGAIALAKAIDPEAKIVVTYSGRKPDVAYFKNASGVWEARGPR